MRKYAPGAVSMKMSAASAKTVSTTCTTRARFSRKR